MPKYTGRIALSAIKTGGGRYKPEDRYKYFLASSIDYTSRAYDDGIVTSTLIPNPLVKIKHLDTLEEWAAAGLDLFVDSGVYSAVQKHVKRHGLTQAEGFAVAPAEIDGFEEMFTEYVELIKVVEPYIWGYVEIDFGGQKNKVITRKRMQDAGISPIPTYHPFNDEYEYFDELAEQYDRVCIGGIANTTKAERTRLLYTINVRKQKYPKLWVHLLGVTPSAMLYQTTIESCDSSSWASGVRYGQAMCYGGGFTIGTLSSGYVYNRSDRSSRLQSVTWAKYLGAMLEKEWKEVKRDERETLELQSEGVNGQ